MTVNRHFISLNNILLTPSRLSKCPQSCKLLLKGQILTDFKSKIKTLAQTDTFQSTQDCFPALRASQNGKFHKIAKKKEAPSSILCNCFLTVGLPVDFGSQFLHRRTSNACSFSNFYLWKSQICESNMKLVSILNSE
jgi:hypothetical protein